LGKKSNILVIGKIAYGIKFSISEDFSIVTNEHKEKDKVFGSEIKRTFGGMAANIAYSLTLLGSPPILVSLVGNDFHWSYRPHLEKIGVDLRLFIDPEKETNCQYEINDQNGNILAIHQANSYHFIAERNIGEKIESKEVEKLECVFVGTGKAEADIKFISNLFEDNQMLPLIYSPDDNIQEITKWRFSQIVQKITLLICTEDELNIIEKRMKMNRNEILKTSKRLKYIISLKSRSNIIIYSQDFKMKVSEGPAEEVLSSGTWQDAFRAGICFCVSLKKPIDEAAKLASALASYAVETRENQQYSPSLEQITLRAFEVRTIQKPE
jgi:ribokinase/adenosine kinase